MANILKRHVVYFVFDGGTTPNVDLSWSQHGIKHSTLNICLEGAPTRWASNGDSEKKIKNCLNYDEVRVRKPVIRKIICVCTHVTYRSTKIKTYKCIGNRNKCVLISLPENKTNKNKLKKRFWWMRDNCLSWHTTTKYTSSCLHHFQDCLAVSICLSYTQIPKTNICRSSTESRLLLSHMLSCENPALST